MRCRIVRDSFPLALALLQLGCGGTLNTDQTSTPPTSTPVQVNIGDAPADRVAAFRIGINSVVMTDRDGRTRAMLNSPTDIEMTHLAGAMAPLSLTKVPQGTYSWVTIEVSDASVTMMDPMTGATVQRPAVMDSRSVLVDFSPPVTLGKTPMVLNCDFDLAGSMSLDASGNVHISPRFRAWFGDTGSGPQDMENGAIEDLVGFVTGVFGSSFTISAEHMGQTLTVATDADTVFEGAAGLQQLAGTMVEVEAVTRPDGSLLAKEVEVKMTMGAGMMNDGMEVKGLITGSTGSPPTELSLLVHSAASPGSGMPGIGSSVAVLINEGTSFRYDSDHVDLNGLPFVPRFDPSTVAKGQKVEADTDSGMGMMSGSEAITAGRIELKPQALKGTVSGLTPAGDQAQFVLAVPADSVFSVLAGRTTLTVYTQPGTELTDLTGIADGDTVRVRGLLFFDGGTYRLVAGRIMRP